MRIRLAFALFPALLAQQTSLVPVEVNQLKPLLDFEAGPAGGVPKGWSTTSGKVSIDDKVVHRGQFSARLQSGSAITLMAPVTFSGVFLTLRGFLKTEGVTEFAGLWIRVDGNSGNPVGYENMHSQGLHGSTDWKEYSIRIPLASNGTYVYFGVLTEGGTTWADDLELLIDGRPVWDVPPKTLAAAQPLTLLGGLARGSTCLIVRGREAPYIPLMIISGPCPESGFLPVSSNPSFWLSGRYSGPGHGCGRPAILPTALSTAVLHCGAGLGWACFHTVKAGSHFPAGRKFSMAQISG